MFGIIDLQKVEKNDRDNPDGMMERRWITMAAKEKEYEFILF